MSTDPHATNVIRFRLDGATIELADPAPTRTLLEFLREDLGRCGTKEGCAEGDCGACTVVIGTPKAERIDWRTVNACIRFLPMLNGCEVVTVESLAAPDGTLHPVQEAMVEAHASQCGFCTPGFVMSLFGLYLDNPHPDRATACAALAGNLCRCTGYRPILDAACKPHRGHPAPVRWSRNDAQSGERRAALAAIQPTRPVHIAPRPGVHNGFDAPLNLDDLARLCVEHPDALLLAGATDIGLWVTKQLRTLPRLIYLGQVSALAQVHRTRDRLHVGAAVSLSDGLKAVVQEYPMLAELAERFASPPIRNAGTLVGNIANGSPIGDSMPVLIALGATVTLRQGGARRELPLEDLYLGYQKKALGPGEFVASVNVPLAQAERRVASYKVAKRRDQDISAVCAGIAVDVRDGVITAARIAFGGMAATPRRAAAAEAALAGQPFSAASFDAAAAALASDYQPLTDMRASADYRLLVAGNLLRRFFLEHARDPAATTAHPPLTVAELGPV